MGLIKAITKAELYRRATKSLLRRRPWRFLGQRRNVTLGIAGGLLAAGLGLLALPRVRQRLRA